MSTLILVVTGARCLEEDASGRKLPRAILWGHGRLCAVLSARPWTHVVTGGAIGPDRWAMYLGAMCDLQVVTYALDGTVLINGVIKRRWTEEKNPHPLVRNKEIITSTKRALTVVGVEAQVYGLQAPWATTHGTAHTLTQAVKAGLLATEDTCPAEYGPA